MDTSLRNETMTYFVHKKVANIVLASFCQEWEGRDIEWEEGPHMRSIKHGQVMITYWGKNGTLMFQGPNASTSEMHRRFTEHKRATEEDKNQTPETPSRMHGGHETNEQTITHVTDGQIAELHRYIINWSAKPQSGREETRGNGTPNLHQEEQQVTSEFKTNLLRYLNQHGLRRVNIET